MSIDNLYDIDFLIEELELKKQRQFTQQNIVRYLINGELKATIELPLKDKDNLKLFIIPYDISIGIGSTNPTINDEKSHSFLEKSTQLLQPITTNDRCLIELVKDDFNSLNHITNCLELQTLHIPNNTKYKFGFEDTDISLLPISLCMFVADTEYNPPAYFIKPIKLNLTFNEVKEINATYQRGIYLQIKFTKKEVNRFVNQIDSSNKNKSKTIIRRKAQFKIYKKWCEKEGIANHKEIGMKRIEVWDILRGMSNNHFKEIIKSDDREMSNFFVYVNGNI